MRRFFEYLYTFRPVYYLKVQAEYGMYKHKMDGFV